MSRFVREFEKILEEENIRSGSRIFQIAGLDRSMLSRIRATGGDNIQFDMIPRIAAAIGSDETFFLRLLRARLEDECTDPRASRIHVTVDDTENELRDHPLRTLPFLTTEEESAMRNIIANIKDAGLRKTVLWLGNEVFSSNRAGKVAAEIASHAVDGARRQAKALRAANSPVRYPAQRRTKSRQPNAKSQS